MTSKEPAEELHQGCKELGWNGVDLAKNAGVTYEKARRALGGIDSPLLADTTKSLVVMREIVVRRIGADPRSLTDEADPTPARSPHDERSFCQPRTFCLGPSFR